MSSSESSQLSLAILDDWASVAEPHFQQIPDLDVHTYPTTLNPSKPSDLEQLKERLKPYAIISTMRERTPFPKSLLSSLPNLRLLLTTGTRNASLDLATRRRKRKQASIPTTPPPGFDSTTQHAWSLLLSLTSRIPTDNTRLHTQPSAWQSGLSVPLGGRTLGICGLGKLGTNMARIGALAFGMKVICWSSSLTQSKADEAAAGAGLGPGAFELVAKEDLFRRADVLSLHYVLSPRSRGLVGAQELALMKPSAIFVNTARGPLVDEQALLQVLEKGGIRGAALDVFWEEPLGPESPWRTTKWGEGGRSRVVLSPHMGYVNEGTMNRWYQEQAETVRKWIKGEEVGNRMA
ncbi:hypothetical protein H2203_001870 [Taxawa tesnikishii (nom. ined.)]|nr:hypothetical protein H2203_001870 [Dothideales sp. JES 119]